VGDLYLLFFIQNLKRYLCHCFRSSFSFISLTTLHLKPQRHSSSPSKQNTRHASTHARTNTHAHTPSQAFSLNICYHLSVSDFLHFGYRFNNASEWRRAGTAQSVQRLATGWTVRGSNPGGGEIFRTRPDRLWGPPSLLYNGYRVFSGGKAGRGVALTTNPQVKERVELYLYSHSGPKWPVLGCTLPLPLPLSEWRISAIFGVGDMAENGNCTILRTTGKIY